MGTTTLRMLSETGNALPRSGERSTGIGLCGATVSGLVSRVAVWSDDFPVWIEQVTQAEPGNYGRLLLRMLGKSKAAIVRTECLYADLERLLPQGSLKIPLRQNVAGVEQLEAVWDGRLVEMVQRSEGREYYPREFLARYGSRILSTQA